MPKRSARSVAEELDALAAIIAAHPEGLTGAEIAEAYNRAHPGRPHLPRYTLVRRLADLEQRGRLVTESAHRWRRYRPAGSEPMPTRAAAAFSTAPAAVGEQPAAPVGLPRPEAGEEIRLSPEGEQVRALVRRPSSEKPTAIAYDENFLRAYQPGVTYYLPESLREELHEAGRTPVSDRPAGTYARHIYERLLIDLSWASSRLEGNQYTRIDTKNLLERNVRAPGKSAKDAQMILNHRKAIELLVDQAAEVGYNRYTFCNLHAALSENLLANPDDEGRLRRHLVGIDGSPFQPLDIPQKIGELFDLMLAIVARIPDFFEQAFFLMVHLPYLQPFADVNKRTSRLAANMPLIKANLIPLSFVGTAEQEYVEGTLGVYEERRVETLRDVFTAAYHRSCERYQAVRRDMAEPDPVRLKYRPQIYTLVAEIVAGPTFPDHDTILAWATRHDVATDEAERFTEIARELLDGLHEGSISRYGIRPSQFHIWRTFVGGTGARPDGDGM